MWGLFYYLPILEHPAIQVKNFYSPYFESTPARQQSKTKFSTPSRTPENAEYAIVQHSQVGNELGSEQQWHYGKGNIKICTLNNILSELNI